MTTSRYISSRGVRVKHLCIGMAIGTLILATMHRAVVGEPSDWVVIPGKGLRAFGKGIQISEVGRFN